MCQWRCITIENQPPLRLTIRSTIVYVCSSSSSGIVKGKQREAKDRLIATSERRRGEVLMNFKVERESRSPSSESSFREVMSRETWLVILRRWARGAAPVQFSRIAYYDSTIITDRHRCAWRMSALRNTEPGRVGLHIGLKRVTWTHSSPKRLD